MLVQTQEEVHSHDVLAMLMEKLTRKIEARRQKQNALKTFSPEVLHHQRKRNLWTTAKFSLDKGITGGQNCCSLIARSVWTLVKTPSTQ